MAQTEAKGGNLPYKTAKAKVEIAEKSALIAVPVPNAGSKPTVFKAENTDDAIQKLNVSFKAKLKKLDGKSQTEEIQINSLEGFEESTIVKESSILRSQEKQKLFLHDFQNELATNEILKDELREILKEENKKALINHLRNWLQNLKKPEPQFLQLLQSHF